MASNEIQDRPPSPASSWHAATLISRHKPFNYIYQSCSYLNFLVSKKPRRALEWCDKEWVPTVLREYSQNMLVQNWCRRLPLIQQRSPAETACLHLASVINHVARNDKYPLEIIDFCSGGGGPTPKFELIINAERDKLGLGPLDFKMCDLYPNISAWEWHCKKSDNLSYIKEPVDATRPPLTALNMDSRRNVSYADGIYDKDTRPNSASKNRIFRLYNLSFHHFDDDLAKQVLRSTLESADGFAIVELQDRRIGCIIMMSLNWLLILLVTPFWFWPFNAPQGERLQRVHHLMLTIPLAYILCWDGVASCLRTREYEEVKSLIEIIKHDNGVEGMSSIVDEWSIASNRELHTWPFGYVNMVTGVRKPMSSRIVGSVPVSVGQSRGESTISGLNGKL